MGDERQAAAAAVQEVGATPVMFETFGGRDADPDGAYLAVYRHRAASVGRTSAAALASIIRAIASSRLSVSA